MNAITEKVCDEVTSDLSSQWIELSDKVRALATNLTLKSAETAVASDAQTLAETTFKLCDHLDQLHRDVNRLLAEIDQDKQQELRAAAANEPTEILQQAIQIQRESHEPSANLKDVIKALFMWRDDPSERLREKH
jgi:DNA polymerase III delta prime subunit